MECHGLIFISEISLWCLHGGSIRGEPGFKKQKARAIIQVMVNKVLNEDRTLVGMGEGD